MITNEDVEKLRRQLMVMIERDIQRMRSETRREIVYVSFLIAASLIFVFVWMSL